MSNPKPQNNTQNPSTSTTTLSPSQYSHTLTTTAIAQILRSLGFKSAKSSALQTLTRIAALFLQSLATTAAAHATSCGRTHSNLFDIIHAIELNSLPLGFAGASAINQPFIASKTLQDLSLFVSAIDELPFRHRVRLSLSSSSSSSSSSTIFAGKLDDSSMRKDDRRGLEVPRWLPPFPELGDDDYKAAKEEDSKECLWEEKKADFGMVRGKTFEKRGKEVVLQGRRERVKFKLGLRSRNSNFRGGLDDYEFRNGVCRGGKRVCLIKNVGDIHRFFEDDGKI